MAQWQYIKITEVSFGKIVFLRAVSRFDIDGSG